MLAPARKRKPSYQKGPPPKRVRVIPPYVPRHRNERKIIPYGTTPFVMSSGQIYMYNPTIFVDPGTGNNQRVGNYIQDARLHYSFFLSAVNYTSLGTLLAESVVFRIFVFTSDKEWSSINVGNMSVNTAGTGNNITAGEMLLDTGADRRAQSFFNLQDIQVIHEKLVTCHKVVNPSTAINGRGQVVRGSVKLGNLRYQGGAGSYLKNKQVYIAITASSSTDVSVDFLGQVRANMLLTFTDS